MDFDVWPIGCEGGQLSRERNAIGPTLNKHQTVSVVDLMVDIVTDASSFAT